jgi:hypothetical protein
LTVAKRHIYRRDRDVAHLGVEALRRLGLGHR